MKKRTGGRRIAVDLALALCAVVVIICIAITLTVLCRPIYYADINYLQIPTQAGVSAEVCRKNYDVLIDYNLLISPEELHFPDFSMSASGRLHFAEVKRIFVGAQIVAIIGVVVFVIWLLRQKRRGQVGSTGADDEVRWLRWTSWVALTVVIVVGSGVALNWDMAFVVMHKVLFRNDYWLFDATTDPIIRILPDAFFLHCGIMIMGLVVVLVVFCRLLAWRLARPKAQR